MTWQNRPGAWISDDGHGGNVEGIINQTPILLLLPPASCLFLFLFLLRVSYCFLFLTVASLTLDPGRNSKFEICNLPFKIPKGLPVAFFPILPYFTRRLTSAGFLDPVTSSIPHHRPDWLYQPDFCIDGFYCQVEPRADLTPFSERKEQEMNSSSMELGAIGIWTAQFDYQPAAKAREAAAELEQLGFGAIWFPESVGRESLTNAALLLGAPSRIVIATGIANIYARDPVTMAAGQKTLAEAYPGRFLLGLGVSHIPLV